MTITVNAIPFDIDKIEADIVTLRDFSGESLDDATLQFKRARPKPTKDFVGMEKGEMKLTVKDPATGQIVGIYSITTSIRADQTEASKAGHLATLGALAAHAAAAALVKEQRLPYSGS